MLIRLVRVFHHNFQLDLGKARLLSGHVAPLFHHWLLHLPWVGPGPGAHLLGNINTLLSGLQLGHQLGDVLASPLWLQGTLFLRGILYHCLYLVIALLFSWHKATASRSTQLPGFLGAPGDWGVLCHRLLLHRAHLLGPLGALGVGGVARGLVLTLLLNLSGTSDNIILNIMNLLLGPALRFILSPADLGALNITVLDKGSPADVGSLIEGNLFIFDEAVLPEVLLTVFFLLGLIVGDIGGVAPPVIGVVTLNHIIVLSLLHHLHLVNTLLACFSYFSKAGSLILCLTVGTALHIRDRMLGMISMVITMSPMMLVEGECSKQVLSLPVNIVP